MEDFHTSYEGKVIGFNGGIILKDREVMPLYKWQELRSKRPGVGKTQKAWR
jgi:hypothetical protein